MPMFDKNKTSTHFFGSRGYATGHFSTYESLGIAVGPDDSVYVSDYSNKRIQIYFDY